MCLTTDTGYAAPPPFTPLAFSKSCAARDCPMLVAQCQGVSPALLEALTLAPSCSSSSMPSTQPLQAALCTWGGEGAEEGGMGKGEGG